MHGEVVNEHAVIIRAGERELLLSYGKAVALKTDSLWIRTRKRWSKTTQRHISGFFGLHDREVVEYPQKWFDGIGFDLSHQLLGEEK